MNILLKLFGNSNQDQSDQTDADLSSQSGNYVTVSYSSPKKDRYEIKGSPSEIYTLDEFRRAYSGDVVHHELIIKSDVIESLDPITTIRGILSIGSNKIKTLSPLKVVTSDIWCCSYDRKSRLRSLGTLQRVEGDANFRYTPLEDLGDLEYVGGNLSLRDTKISDLGRLSYVGGNLFLPKRLKDKIDLSCVSVGGQVRYWNDAKLPENVSMTEDSGVVLQKSPIPIPYWPQRYIYPHHDMSSEPDDIQKFYKYFKETFINGTLLDTEGYTNYFFMLAFDLKKEIHDPNVLASKYEELSRAYPILKGYCDDILVDVYNDKQMYVNAWDIVKNTSYLSYKIIRFYTTKIGHDILDGVIAAKLCGTSCLTNFGQSHIDNILPFFKPCLEKFEKEKGCCFHDLFYDSDMGYKSINGKYVPEYYKQFYQLDTSSYSLYEAIGMDEYHANRLDEILVVEHAVLEQLRVLLIAAEDAYRESIGVPKIGEGWISETALFYKIKEHYKYYKVVQHGRPKWLGKQHFDIYFPENNIAIEYQGIQHYQAVDYFGGEEGLASNQERDERKRGLCKKHSCKLICVNEGYKFDDVITSIDNALRGEKFDEFIG